MTTTTVSRRTFSSRSRHNTSRYTVQTLSFPEPSGGLTLTLTPQRRVIGKAEYLEKGANPRFIVHIIIGGAHGRARSIRKLLLRARHGRPLTPVHQCTRLGSMRLTVNLEPDLYALAKSLAKDEDCTISGAVNRLLRRALHGAPQKDGRGRSVRRNQFVVSRGRRPVTADTLRRIEAGDDEQ